VNSDNAELEYLNVLKLNFGATEEEIKAQFRKLAFEYHPDSKKEGITQEEEKARLDNFVQIKEAMDFFEQKFARQKLEEQKREQVNHRY
jgi:DnaJ-class molecular chaperone